MSEAVKRDVLVLGTKPAVYAEALELNAREGKTEFPPGLVGDVAEYIMKTSRYPNAGMALGAALSVVAKLCDRRVAGPTNSTTVSYIALLGPTGVGKQRPLAVTKIILAAVGREELIGPGDLASVQALQSLITRDPWNKLCVFDEFGIMLRRLVAEVQNPNSSSITREFNSLWGILWDRYDSVERAHEQASFAVGPGFAFLAVSTLKEFYEALSAGLVGNGFINRLLIMMASPKSAGCEPELMPDIIPPELLAALTKLAVLGGQTFPNGTEGKATLKPLVRLGWGPGTEARYNELEARMAATGGRSERESDLQQRTPEHTIRVATAIAAGRGSHTVDMVDMEWGERLALASLAAIKEGLERYAPDLTYRELCDDIHEALIASRDKWLSMREINRRWGRRNKYKSQVDPALAQLKSEGVAEEDKRMPVNGGTLSPGWKLVG